MALLAVMALEACGRMKQIPRVQSENKDISQLQQNILAGINSILANPLVNGSLVLNKSLSVGNNSIAHGLGRQAQGRAIVYQSSQSDIYDYQVPDDSFFYFNSSAETTISLYVF